MLFASTSFLSTQGDIRSTCFDRRLVLRGRHRLLRTSCRTDRPWFSDRPGRLLKKGPESGKAGEAGTAAVPAFGEVQRPRTQSARAEVHVIRDSPAPGTRLKHVARPPRPARSKPSPHEGGPESLMPCRARHKRLAINTTMLIKTSAAMTRTMTRATFLSIFELFQQFREGPDNAVVESDSFHCRTHKMQRVNDIRSLVFDVAQLS